MSFPPESPQDYFDYFQYMALNAKPSNLKWAIGLKAATMWHDYFEKGNVKENNQLLIPLVKTLMPISNAGTLFLDLWQKILRHIGKLPASEQIEIWFEIFNKVNQGERKIAHNEVAREVLEEWIKLDISEGASKINKKVMIDMVDKIYKYTFSGQEWIALTVALSEWFKKYIPAPSLYDLVCGKFEKKLN